MFVAPIRRRTEREIGRALARTCLAKGFRALVQVRLHPCEMDLVVLDPATARIGVFELKRRDWRTVLEQARRAQLYAHFAAAVLPLRMASHVPAEEFERFGVGLVYYSESAAGVAFSLGREAMASRVTNRHFKQLLYREFARAFGGLTHA